MITLQQFLNQEVSTIQNVSSLQAMESGYFSALTDLSLIEVTGENAAEFLHNQLSNDVQHLATDEARLAAYCTPKGRMLASLLFWKSGSSIFLQISSTLQASIQKRLQMFVMRAKVKLTNVSEEYVAIGLGGENSGKTLQAWFPQVPESLNAKIDSEYGSLIRAADAYGHARYEWIIQRAVLENIWAELQVKFTHVSDNAWRRAEILAGIPHITDKTQELFVPQMVNFELIGGVNFKKGCYPGQEIVARSQYLGKLKRRMFIAEIASNDVQAGMEVFSSADTCQPCGTIVNAEIQDENNYICVVEMKVADQEAGDIHLGSDTESTLKFLPLPYPMLDITQ
ncbi:MAG: folate-binding protein [Pseudomonadota bacterium]